MKNIFYLLFFLSLASLPGISQISSYPVTTNEEVPFGVPYFLPRTSLQIDFQIRKTDFKAGLYAPYAKRYLGIQSVLKNDSINYTISDIRITSRQKPDPKELYIATYRKSYDSRLDKILSFTEGYITLKNSNIFLPEKEISTSLENDQNLLLHSIEKISLTGTTKTITDTLYKTVFEDSVFVQVPVYREKTKEKSLNERAEETAEFLVNLQKAQLTILADWETTSPPKSKEILKYAVNELREIEKGYLEQFTGSITKNNYGKRMAITPVSESEKDTSLLFYFSEKKGIHTQGDPVYLVIEKVNQNTSLDFYKKNLPDKKKSDYLHYRSPEQASVKIIFRDSILAETLVLMYQYGISVPVPVDFLIREEKLK